MGAKKPSTTMQQIRRLYEAQPFQAFTMKLADGRTVPVLRREFMMLLPSGQTIIVQHADDKLDILDASSVGDVKVPPRGTRAANNQRKQRDTLMTIQQIRRLYSAQPFQPFTMHLADGRQIPVLHPEFMMALPSGRTVYVCQPDDTVNIVDLLLVTDLEVRPAKNGSQRRKK